MTPEQRAHAAAELERLTTERDGLMRYLKEQGFSDRRLVRRYLDVSAEITATIERLHDVLPTRVQFRLDTTQPC